eukprot:scaffold482_cov247-Pinguiococcus_pyrenoidosus.AAC.31
MRQQLVVGESLVPVCSARQGVHTPVRISCVVLSCWAVEDSRLWRRGAGRGCAALGATEASCA